MTGLDTLGIPVVTVCRPNSRSVAVAMGKGVDIDAAEASGLLEAIETYHAERIMLPLKYASYEELRYTNQFADLDALPKRRDSIFHPYLPLLWVEGWDLLSGTGTLVPFEIVHTNYTKPMPPGSGCFPANSNGLASGNTLLEALSYGICEVIERDATALWHCSGQERYSDRRVRPESVTDRQSTEVIHKLMEAKIDVAIWETTTDIGVPSFYCWLWEQPCLSNVVSRPTVGAGCHPRRGTALCRALTEAAQDRLTLITGSRDDLRRSDYHKISPAEVVHITPKLNFEHIPSHEADDLADILDWELGQLMAAGIKQVVMINLTRSEFLSIPVVKVIIPGLEGLIEDLNYAPGKRAAAADARMR